MSTLHVEGKGAKFCTLSPSFSLTNTDIHAHTNTFLKVPTSFSDQLSGTRIILCLHDSAGEPLSRYSPACMSPVGICLFRRSYITPGSDLYSRVIYGQALPLNKATATVTFLYASEWILLSVVGKFTCSHHILIGRAWHWDDSECCFVQSRLAKYWFCWQIWQSHGDGKLQCFSQGPSNLWQHSLVIMHPDPASDND